LQIQKFRSQYDYKKIFNICCCFSGSCCSYYWLCSSNGTTAATTTSGVQSSVTAVNGYVYNATGKAYYLAEDNASLKTLTSTDTTKDVVSGEITVGSAVYSLPSDTNDSVKSRIKFFSIGKNLYFFTYVKVILNIIVNIFKRKLESVNKYI